MKRKSIDKMILNGMLSGVLAMGIGTGTAFANGTQTTEAAASATPVPAPASATPVSAPFEESQKLILPGDFFYFLKTFVEKVEIVLTTDDVNQAKLLTVFTQERIREADVLFVRGKPELAVAVLHKALDDQEQVMENDKEDAGSSANQELADHYRSNLEALTFVLEKVKNPHAKAALARNIEKTKAKLALITIPAQETGEKPENGVEFQVHVTQEQKSGVEDKEEADHEDAEHDVKVEHDDEGEHDDDGDHDEDNQKGSGNDNAAKANHEKLKQERKAAHERAKMERKAAHEQAKHHH